jgi:hypothetical protein
VLGRGVIDGSVTLRGIDYRSIEAVVGGFLLTSVLLHEGIGKDKTTLIDLREIQ